MSLLGTEFRFELGTGFVLGFVLGLRSRKACIGNDEEDYHPLKEHAAHNRVRVRARIGARPTAGDRG